MQNKQKLLIVEDDPVQLKRYSLIASASFDIFEASHFAEAVGIIDSQPIDILLVDIHLKQSLSCDEPEGFQILEYVAKHQSGVLPIVMSSDPNIESYHQAFYKGALHFLKKPILSLDEIKIAIQSAKERRNLSKGFHDKHDKPWLSADLNKLCPDGLVLDEAVRKLVRQVAKSRHLAFTIYGETGTGKEEVAKLVHKHREIAEGPIPFVAVNCANLDDNIASSLLFGHRKGAFTGADTSTLGYIGEANGGLLFLDEIHRLPISCQQRLLRVLNDGTYQRLGDSRTLSAEFQVLVASTEDLDQMVADGKLLPDLRYRISGVELHLPPLRERLDDIDLLVTLFFAKENLTVAPSELVQLIQRCKDCQWPGNIRQLTKALSTLATLSYLNEEPIKAVNLPIRNSMKPNSLSMESLNTEQTPDIDPEIVQRLLQPLLQDQALKDSLEYYEKLILERSIARHRLISKVVEALDTNRSSIDLKRKKYHL